MNNLIILEGPDNMGKTTLAKEILAHVNKGVYLHGIKVGGPRHQLRYHNNLINIAVDNLDLETDCVVIDRHWISHLVYSGYAGFEGDEYAEHFIGCLNLLKAVYVFCYSEKGEQEYSKNIDPDHPYTVSEYARYCKSYRNLYTSFSSKHDRVYEYDFTQHGKNQDNLNHFVGTILDNGNI